MMVTEIQVWSIITITIVLHLGYVLSINFHLLKSSVKHFVILTLTHHLYGVSCDLFIANTWQEHVHTGNKSMFSPQSHKFE